MSKDTIYREDAIKEIEEYIVKENEAISEHPDDIFKYNSGLLTAIQAVHDLPSADRPQGWIPCSERLPEDNERVLVTTAWGYVTIGWIKQNIWSTDSIVNLRDFVLAWMPLPEPWKGADDE